MIPYEWIRSGRRTMSMELRPDGRVIVRTNYRTTFAEVDAFVEKHKAWLFSHIEKQKNRSAPRIPETDDEKTVAALKEKANRVLPPKIAYYAKLLGVTPTHVSINRAHSRYGSCSQKNRLNFSCYLMLYPDAAIDYVVVHELCHIKEHNHSKNFYALVASILPDYRERQALLKN